MAARPISSPEALIPEACHYGKITLEGIGAVPDPDTTSTLSVQLANTNLQLSTAVTHADADDVLKPPILVYGGTWRPRS